MEIDFAGLIANVGFPIVAFLMMYQIATRTIKDNTKAIREMVFELKNRK